MDFSRFRLPRLAVLFFGDVAELFLAPDLGDMGADKSQCGGAGAEARRGAVLDHVGDADHGEVVDGHRQPLRQSIPVAAGEAVQVGAHGAGLGDGQPGLSHGACTNSHVQ